MYYLLRMLRPSSFAANLAFNIGTFYIQKSHQSALISSLTPVDVLWIQTLVRLTGDHLLEKFHRRELCGVW